MIKKKARQIAIEYLTEWGEWEADGRYSARENKSQLGRYVKQGVGEASGGHGSIPVLYIPDRISKTARAMACLKDDRPKHYRALWLSFVRAYNIDGVDRIQDSREDYLRAAEMRVKVASYRIFLSAALDIFVFYLANA